MRLYRPPKKTTTTNKTQNKHDSDSIEVVVLEEEEDDDNDVISFDIAENNEHCNDDDNDNNDDDDDDDDDILTSDYIEEQDHQFHKLSQPPAPNTYYEITLPNGKRCTNPHHHYHCSTYHYCCMNESSSSSFHPLSSSSWQIGQPVWVCKSKGAKHNNNNNNNNSSKRLSSSQLLQPQPQPQLQHPKQRYELFLRATIVNILDFKINDGSNSNKNSTICQVRYPMGSTYHVRSELLIPIWDRPTINRYLITMAMNWSTNMNPKTTTTTTSTSNTTTTTTSNTTNTNTTTIVLVVPETKLYRRACLIHTVPTTDHFIEIGCAQGMTCHRIDRDTSNTTTTTTTCSPSPLLQEPQRPSSQEQQEPRRRRQWKRRMVVGIDKSISCIHEAHARYKSHPSDHTRRNSYLQFVTHDIFQSPLPSTTTTTTTTTTSSKPYDSDTSTNTNITNTNRNDVDNSDDNETCDDDDDVDHVKTVVQEIIHCFTDGYHQSRNNNNNESISNSIHHRHQPTCHSGDLDPIAGTAITPVATTSAVTTTVAMDDDTATTTDINCGGVPTSNGDTDTTTTTTSNDHDIDDVVDGTTDMDLVIAIDINGNRHLPPILQCLQMIAQTHFPKSLSLVRPQPRLIIVKSRALYLFLQERQQQC